MSLLVSLCIAIRNCILVPEKPKKVFIEGLNNIPVDFYPLGHIVPVLKIDDLDSLLENKKKPLTKNQMSYI
jgi:hypothetical protein